MSDKKQITKELMKEAQLLTTDTTYTTYTTINNWGYINLKEKILIEQINSFKYIYNINGKIGILNKEKINEKDKEGKPIKNKEYYILNIEGLIFRFKENRIREPLYMIPSKEECFEFIDNGCNIETTQELFIELEKYLNSLFDFRNKGDAKKCALYILFSYVIPYFNSSFFFGIDATKGAGKTTLLEIIAFLSRHGFLADVSPASIPRLKEKYDLSIFVDEIDELKNKEDIEGLLRKGQRRGNKYVRLNKNSLEEEIYEAFGIYGYSFRSSVEDAFKQRSIITRTATAKDGRLSVINLEKNTFLKPIFNKIFFWYIKNIFEFGSSSSKVVRVVGKSTNEQINFRDNFYDNLTSDFSKEENELIKKLFGRNSEIAYLFIRTCKLLKLNLLEEISKIIEEKQEDEEVPDNYYVDLIIEIFNEKLLQNQDWTLSKGEFIGYKYYPKTLFYFELIKTLKEHNLSGIGFKKWNSLLKDIGFIDKFNIRNQKTKGEKNPKPCLIFSKDVLKKLGIEYEEQIIDKIEIQKFK